MTRRQQDALTRLVAIGILVSQATPWVPERPTLLVVVGGLLGLPLVRKVQDAINAIEAKGETEDAAP